MSVFSGPQGKGAMRKHRERKRREAEQRNADAHARYRDCGHVHGRAQVCRAPEAVR